MFTLKRNQVIITALVVMIAVAGYLNHIDTRVDDFAEGPGLTYNEQNEIAALIADGELFFDELELMELSGLPLFDTTHNPAIAVSADWAPDADPSEAVFVSSTREASFFVQAKLNREQARAAEKSVLTGLINNDNVEAAQRAQAADSMLDIQRRIERESAAESLIESKGFSEVYVRIGENTVDVVVAKEVLTEAEVAIIEDIVRRKTGMQTSQIQISPMRR